MSEENTQVAVPKKELAELQAKMNLLGVNISKNSMESMDALLHRMDAIDNAIAALKEQGCEAYVLGTIVAGEEKVELC